MDDSIQRGRQLLPAPTSADGTSGHGSSGGDGGHPPKDVLGLRQKRTQISVACEICRKRKAKCDGIRPQCTPCSNRGLTCEYVADPDATRMTTLKRKYHALEERHTTYEGLFSYLQRASSPDALAAFQRIRAGVTPELILTPASLPTSVSADTAEHSATELAYPGSSSHLSPLGVPISPTDPDNASYVRHRMNVNALLADNDAALRRQEGMDAGRMSDAGGSRDYDAQERLSKRQR